MVSVEAGVAGSGAGGGSVVEAGGPRTWCTGQNVLFCEDFDRYTDINELLNAPGYNYSLIGGQFSLASDVLDRAMEICNRHRGDPTRHIGGPELPRER